MSKREGYGLNYLTRDGWMWLAVWAFFGFLAGGLVLRHLMPEVPALLLGTVSGIAAFFGYACWSGK